MLIKCMLVSSFGLFLFPLWFLFCLPVVSSLWCWAISVSVLHCNHALTEGYISWNIWILFDLFFFVLTLYKLQYFWNSHLLILLTFCKYICFVIRVVDFSTAFLSLIFLHADFGHFPCPFGNMYHWNSVCDVGEGIFLKYFPKLICHFPCPSGKSVHYHYTWNSDAMVQEEIFSVPISS